MAKPEARIMIHLEPSEETLQMSKHMLEMWLNAAPGRGAKVVDKCDEDGNLKSYLEIFDVNTGQEWGVE